MSRVTIPVMPGAELVVERDGAGLYIHLHEVEALESVAFMFVSPSELNILVMESQGTASLVHGRAHFRFDIKHLAELRAAFPDIEMNDPEGSHG